MDSINTPYTDWRVATDGTLRIAVVGLGWFTREYAIPGIERSELCTPSIAITGSAETATTVTETTSVDATYSYDEFADGAATEDYDAVYIATPNSTHLDYTRIAAKHGKHVLCEKPMEVSVERAREMIDCCATDGVTLMVGYRLHADPLIRRIRDLLAEGVIGDPVQIHGSMTGSLPALFDDPNHWRYDQDLSGGCAMIDIGVYPLNTTRFILQADPRTVQSNTVTLDDRFDGVDEHVTFELEFPSGVTGAFIASHNAHPSSHLEFIGTNGRIRIDPAFRYERRATVDSPDMDCVYESTQSIEDHLANEFDYFATAVLTDSTPSPDGTDGLIDVAVVEAVYESAANGTRQTLEHP